MHFSCKNKNRIFIFQAVVGQEETQCRGHDVNLTPEQRGQITDCLKEAGISSIWKIPAEKLAVSKA